MTTGLYTLDENGTPVEATDTRSWGGMMEQDRKVAETIRDGYRISTVFLGIDHNFRRVGPPVLWETMIFPDGSWDDLYCNRYTSVEDARQGHDYAVTHLHDLIGDTTQEEARMGP